MRMTRWVLALAVGSLPLTGAASADDVNVHVVRSERAADRAAGAVDRQALERSDAHGGTDRASAKVGQGVNDKVRAKESR